MKGSLHTDELMAAVVKRDTGLRTARRVSHCFVMDVPGHDGRADHHRRRGQHRADAGGQGRHRAERDRPRARAAACRRCAWRSSRRWRPSTRRCRRPSRRRRCARWPTAARSPARSLDGPLALDNAINLEAAKIKKIDSPVAGRANVLRRARPRSRQHARQEPVLPRRRRRRRHRARRARADHPDQPRRLGDRRGSPRARSRRWSPRRGARRRQGRGVTPWPTSILVLNAGSSSIKFSAVRRATATRSTLVAARPGRRPLHRAATSSPSDAHGAAIGDEDVGRGHEARPRRRDRPTWSTFLRDASRAAPAGRASAIASCTAGWSSREPVRVDARSASTRSRSSCPLAPLHQPHNLDADPRSSRSAARTLPQVACFDTAFHRAQPRGRAGVRAAARRSPTRGVRRYGFHGLSYEYIASVLPRVDAERGGAAARSSRTSATARACARCAAGRSVASTMGFTAVDGLPMGTRCGSLDPGVILYLMDELRHGCARDRGPDLQAVGPARRVGHLERHAHAARERRPARALAVDLFVYRIGRELGSLAAALGGLDALVFTARHRRARGGDPRARLPRRGLARRRARRRRPTRPAARASARAASRVAAWVDPDQRGTDDRAPHARATVRAHRIARSIVMSRSSHRARC